MVEEDLEKERLSSIFLEQLQKEQKLLAESFPICSLLIEDALERFNSTGLLPGSENYADILNEKPIKLTQNVIAPDLTSSADNIFFNKLQNEAQCTIKIKRKASVSDKLRQLSDTQNKDLHKDYYLEISTSSSPIECYSRITLAMVEIRSYLKSREKNMLPDDLHERGNVKEEVEFIEDVTSEHLNAADKLEDDPLVDLFEEPLPQLVMQGEQEDPGAVTYFALANKLIKLLDATVLNPNFNPQTEEPQSNLPTTSSEAKTLTSLQLETFSSSMPTSSYLITDEDITKASIKDSSENTEDSDTEGIIEEEEEEVEEKLDNRAIKSFVNSSNNSEEIIEENNQKGIIEKKDIYPGLYYLRDEKTNEIKKHRILHRSVLYRFLKRHKKEGVELEVNGNEEPYCLLYLQCNPLDLVFEYAPRDVIISLLEGIKKYPVLWHFHGEPFNEEYKNATEELCKTMNEEWILSLEHIHIRRSINRVLRFYRYLYPSESLDKFSEYFDICSTFLPPAVIQIPHARCPHCFKCCAGDFELKKHVLQKHHDIKWRYRCVYCAEFFQHDYELDLHKLLPHFVEVFTCEFCNLRFNVLNQYNKHIKKRHDTNCEIKISNETKKKGKAIKIKIKPTTTVKPKEQPLLKNHICEKCGKGFKTTGELKNHLVYHGKKMFKCHLCHKSYHRNFCLMMHLKTHRKELDYVCEICGAKFVCAKNLKGHLDTHMGVRVACKICGLKVRKGSLLRHLRTIHIALEGTLEDTFRAKNYHHNSKMRGNTNRKGNKTRNLPVRREGRAAEKQPRQYACKKCNIKFERLKFLKEHNQECHLTIMENAKCKICNAEVRKKNLRLHMKERHKMTDFQMYALEEKNEDVNTVLEMRSQYLDEFLEKVKQLEKN